MKKYAPCFYIAVIVINVLILLIYWAWPSTHWYQAYLHHFFLPYQSFRSTIDAFFAFSWGDIWYVVLILVLFIGLFRLVKYTWRWKKIKRPLRVQLLRFLAFLFSVYSIYLWSWGANYKRPKLWAKDLDTGWTNAQLLSMNQELVASLNQFEPIHFSKDIEALNRDLSRVYKKESANILPHLQVKPSLFGNMIFYLGIQGYYNPFTGEAQFARNLPEFMWPFVFAHEMAHQVGIAAEGDANFLAYVICEKSQVPALQYSATFNLLLYANRELARVDSVQAREVLSHLTLDHSKRLDDLKKFRAQFRSGFSGLAMDVYDWMLLQQGQTKGLKSYNEMARLVSQWHSAGSPALAF